MCNHLPDRDYSLQVFKEYNKSENLYRHALAVEAVMRHFALLYGEDPDKWGVIGLIHDIDYEQYPDQHCTKAGEILKEKGYPDDYIHAVQSHGWGIVSDVEPTEKMEKVLYATDELTGLIAAVALMRPSKSVLDLKLSSVKKKWKQKSFASGANREVIAKGAHMLGIELDELIEQTIKGMQSAAQTLGLKGEV
jgi:putative nucleotidyltransferase with HDIG domain